MPIAVVFEASAFGPAVAVDAAPGEMLRDLCDQHRAPVPFGCRSASCGTCLVEIVEGGELLAPAGAAEQFVLDTLAASATHRLACQSRLATQARTQRPRALVRVRVAKLPRPA